MKKNICLLLFLMILISMFNVVFAESNIKVIVDEVELQFDVPPQMINGRTMVPLRAIFEAMGAVVQWDEDTQTISAYKNDIIILMQINNNSIFKNYTSINIDVPPQIINGRTLVPVRVIAECLGATVQWDDSTSTVVITKDEPYIQSNNEIINITIHGNYGDKLVLKKGLIHKINFSYSPSNANEYQIDVSSSNPYVVIAWSGTKTLQPMNEGTSIITLRAPNGVYDTCTAVVIP